MSEMIAGFLHGLTFYPWPCLVYDPFGGWSPRKMRAYVGGVLTAIAAFPIAFVSLVVSA